MALRDKLADRVQRLVPDERIEAVFMARAFEVIRNDRNYVIAATDRRIVVFRAGLMTPARPQEEVESFPRADLSASLDWEGRYLGGSIELGGTKYLFEGKFRPEVEAAVRPPADPA